MIDKIIEEYSNAKLGLFLHMPITFENKRKFKSLPTIPTIGRNKKSEFSYKSYKKKTHDYSKQNFKVYRWLGSFDGFDNTVEQMLDFEFSALRERAGEPLFSLSESNVMEHSNGICLVFNSSQINAVYTADCFSLVVGNKLFPTKNLDTFCTEFSRTSCLFGEAFIKLKELPVEVIATKLTSYKKLKEYLKKNNLKIKVTLVVK